jgi:hypothetical protein
MATLSVRQEAEHDWAMLHRIVVEADHEEFVLACDQRPDRQTACVDADALRQHGTDDAALGVRAGHIADERDAAHRAREIRAAFRRAVADLGQMRERAGNVARGGENIFGRCRRRARSRDQMFMQIGNVALRVPDALRDAEHRRREQYEAYPKQQPESQRPAATPKHFS